MFDNVMLMTESSEVIWHNQSQYFGHKGCIQNRRSPCYWDACTLSDLKG